MNARTRTSITSMLDENALNFGTYSKEDLDQKLSALIFDKTKKINTIIGPINGELGFELYEIIS